MVKYKKFLGKVKYLLLPKYILLSRTLFTNVIHDEHASKSFSHFYCTQNCIQYKRKFAFF